MTLLLASVTGPAEAAVALAQGADVIDLKDPARGGFGAVDPETVRATVDTVAGRRPVSAVAGELALRPETVRPVAEALAGAGAAWIKLGLFPGGDLAGTLAALAPLARRVRLAGVIFADLAAEPAELAAPLPALAQAGFAGAMLDTARKDRGRLLDACGLPALARFVAACREHDLLAGLAGALEPPDIPRLLVLQPGLLGFRGALCAGGRAGPIDEAAVRLVRALIPPEAGGAEAGLDWRLLAPGYTPDPQGDPAATDRIFLRDLVLPVEIGAYARERGRAQRVRFDVTVLVGRPARVARDMRDVFSYDVISDGIRLLIARGHVDFVETLAERIAAMLLADPRVVQASVQVTKLDTGAGEVGVAIERSRATLPETARVW